MSIDDEIAAAKVAAVRRLARLRERQRLAQARVDARVLAILRNRIQPDALQAIEAEAVRQVESEVAERSRRAREARQKRGVAHSSDASATATTDAHAVHPVGIS